MFFSDGIVNVSFAIDVNTPATIPAGPPNVYPTASQNPVTNAPAPASIKVLATLSIVFFPLLTDAIFIEKVVIEYAVHAPVSFPG